VSKKGWVLHQEGGKVSNVRKVKGVETLFNGGVKERKGRKQVGWGGEGEKRGGKVKKGGQPVYRGG